MAEHYQQQQHHYRPGTEHHGTIASATDTIKSYLPINKAPSTTQMVALATLLPVGGVLFCLAGLILAGTLLGLAVATPLFVIFSPIIIPAVLAISLSVVGFITAGGFGITALSSVSWLLNYMRNMQGRTSLPEHFEHAKRRVGDAAAHVGHKAQDVMS